MFQEKAEGNMIDSNEFGKNTDISFCPHCRTRNPNGGSNAVRCSKCGKIYQVRKPLKADTGMKLCPECLEPVKKEATRCSHCGHEFRPVFSIGGILSAAGFILCLIIGLVMVFFGQWIPASVLILFGTALHRLEKAL